MRGGDSAAARQPLDRAGVGLLAGTVPTVFVVALLALIVSATAALFAGLTWWNSRAARRASETSATAATTSAEQATTSAAAADRCAASAEEQLARDDADRVQAAEAREREARTPAFRMGKIDWRGSTFASDVPIYLESTSPFVWVVEVAVIGAVGLRLYGASDGPNQLRVRWERPSPGGPPLRVAFERPTRDTPVRLRLVCQVGEATAMHDEIVELDLPVENDAVSVPAR